MSTPKNKSIKKAFALLRSFGAPHERLSVAELSRRTGLAKPSAHRLMLTLEEVGAVMRDARGCYRPAMVLAAMSEGVAVGDLICETSGDLLDGLAASLQGVIHVGVLEGGMVNYAARVGRTRRVPIPSQVGAKKEAYCSALGKILLAGLAAPELEDFLRIRKFAALTERTITSNGRLKSEISSARQRGYAIDNGEAFSMVCCVGVPIRDPVGRTVAALSFADSAEQLCPAWEKEVANSLVSTARKISGRIFSNSPRGPGLRGPKKERVP